jgi:hypothetical protein
MKVCFDIDAYCSHERRIHNVPPSEGGNIYLSKAPKDVLVVGPLLRVNPKLYVIYMVRDPRDIITSKHESDPDKYWTGLRHWRTYTRYAERIEDHPRFITVRYEDFVRSPDSTQEKLHRRMPFLEKVAPFSCYHEVAEPSENSLNALGSVRPIAPTSVGRWRDHLPRVAGQIEIFGSITDDLIKYGYEEDDSWEGILEGVEPDLTASHWPDEDFAPSDIAKRRRGLKRAVIKMLLERIGINVWGVRESLRQLFYP